jgi:Arc/MetJ-type ribon-helix-helix transcriptional regulator
MDKNDRAVPGSPLDVANGLRYVLGMTKKIAISLPDSTLEKARAAIRAGRAPNVSSYMARLIEDASATETFDEMIAAWVRDSGASHEEIDAAYEESRRAFERAGLVGRGYPREKAARKAG